MSSPENTPKPSVQAAILQVDSDWRIISVNDKAGQIIGVAPEELIGLTIEEIFYSKVQFSSLTELCQPITEGHVVINHPVLVCNGTSDTGKAVLISIIPLPEGYCSGGAIISMQDANEHTLLHQITLDFIADGVFTVDENWKITSFNKAAEKITGWSREEVIGSSCGDIFHSKAHQKMCLLKDSLKDGRPITDKPIFMRDRFGKSIPVSISAAPITTPDGRIIGGVQTIRDDTINVRNDLILNSVADGVFTVDANWNITSFNRAAEKLTGWSSEEILGKSCSTIFQSSICGDSCLLRKAIKDGKTTINRPIFIKTREGTSIPVSVSASPLVDDQGNIIGGIETFRDNTHSIRESMILASIADGVFTVDKNWRITSFNAAAEAITGWNAEDALGKSCGEVFHSSICGKNCAIAESLYSGTPVANRSITIRDKNGEKVPISISASPLIDHEGNIIGGVETFRDLTTITQLRRELSRKYTFDEIISKSVAMQRLFKIMPEIARSPSTVLILGESGTGKELIARALYNASERRNKPFVTVNCGALPETLLESELFGYKAGAFTDARKDKKGRFAAAEGGTLFLDEIGDIPHSIQVKLLRVLQEKIYEPLGSNTPVKADVRIITATNRNLQELVQQGLFREDLFYRLNVVKIQLPPLRERKEDIPLLIEHFIKKYSAQQGKDIVGISSSALNILMRYDYPGNIRELENIIEYSFILCEGGYIQPEHLPDTFTGTSGPDSSLPGSTGAGPQTLEEVEKQAIYLALERNKWRKMATCRELGVSKDTLRRKIKKYGLERPLDRELREAS
ncbi:sigma 54-interacting transcriptional regulator [Desulfolithobacter sp.]